MRVTLCRLRVVSARCQGGGTFRRSGRTHSSAAARGTPGPVWTPGRRRGGCAEAAESQGPSRGRGPTGGSARAKGGGGHRETGRVPALSALR